LNIGASPLTIVSETLEESCHVAHENPDIDRTTILAPKTLAVGENPLLQKNGHQNTGVVRNAKGGKTKSSSDKNIFEEVNEIHFNSGVVVRFRRRTAHRKFCGIPQLEGLRSSQR
jgi:hypothetical protein